MKKYFTRDLFLKSYEVSNIVIFATLGQFTRDPFRAINA